MEFIFFKGRPQEHVDGFTAYSRYNMLLGNIAERTGYSLSTTCGVFSALSPNNDYLGNLRDAFTLLLAARNLRKLDSFKVSTYGANKTKAWRIAHGVDPRSAIVASKTLNFYLNCLDPKDPIPVTIDGHMMNIWNGTKLPLASRNKKTVRVNVGAKYDLIASDVHQVSSRLNILPNQFQATVWLIWRRLMGVQSSQLSLWDRDAEIAGYGYTTLR